MEQLTPDEQKLVGLEYKFNEEKGHAASLTEMAKYSGWSTQKVSELRATIDRKGYAKQKKEGNKKTLLLFASAMGVITAGIGAAAVVPSLRKMEKPTTPIITPSGLPSQTAPYYQQPVYIPERSRDTLRETYIERGGREHIQRDVSPYYQQQVQTQDKCLELGWEWKDGVCHPPDSGDSQIGIGDNWCQQMFTAAKSGDQKAILNYNQYIAVCGDYVNPTETEAILRGFCHLQDNCWNTEMKLCDNTKDKNCNPKSSRVSIRKTNCESSGGTWNETNNLCRCKTGYAADLMSNCKKIGDIGESLPDRCRRLGGNWTGFTCQCPDGKSGQYIDCTTHGGRETEPEKEVTEEVKEWQCDNCPGLGQSDCAGCSNCMWDFINRRCMTKSTIFGIIPKTETEEPSDDCVCAGLWGTTCTDCPNCRWTGMTCVER